MEKSYEKVLVYGKAQNRTALGIVNAYLAMYPNSTLADLNKAFPVSLNSSNRHTSLFADVVKDREKFKTQNETYNVFEMFFFEKDDEVLTLKDGTRLALQELWQKDDFNKIVEHAKQYGIVIADYKPTKGYEKGGFRLEYLNGYLPPALKPKKKTGLIVAIIIILLLLLGLLAYFFCCKSEPEVPVVVKTETKTEEVVEIIETTIEKNFNAAQFEKGKSELNDAAKAVLQDLVKLLNEYQEIKLEIVGHTSIEGDANFNQKLSEARAQACVDYLVNEGIDVERLNAQGKGSSEPIDNENLEANRRTEFIVIE